MEHEPGTTDRMDRIEDRLEKHSDLLLDIHSNLREHMRRTEIAETNIDSIADRVAPIQKHVAMVEGIGTVVAFLTVLIGTIAAIWAVFK